MSTATADQKGVGGSEANSTPGSRSNSLAGSNSSSTTTLGSAGGYVGFANLPNQVHRKSVKKGFEFTLMVVGESGLGKSTLINSLFLSDLYSDRKVPDAKGNINALNGNSTGDSGFGKLGGVAARIAEKESNINHQRGLLDKYHKNIKITAKTVEIEERGVKLRLTVVDTPGFGDAIDNSDSFGSIIKYIDDQFEKYFHGERGLNRRNIADNRVHCCFYFISPWGHGLKPLDIEFMKQLHQKVNIVPVIAKSDVLTKKEVATLKKRVLEEIKINGIRTYSLPEVDEDEDEDYKEELKQLKEAMPFAVSASTTFIEAKGVKLRGILFPWGHLEIENPEHCDFVKLRTMLITHMQDLQEVTQEVHYENYRLQKLASEAKAGVKAELALEESNGGDNDEMKRKLMEKEAELRRMQEMVAKMQANINNGQKL